MSKSDQRNFFKPMRALIDNSNKVTIKEMEYLWWRLMIIIWAYQIFNFKRIIKNKCRNNNCSAKDHHKPILKDKLNSSSPLLLKRPMFTVRSMSKMSIISNFKMIKRSSKQRDTSNKMKRCQIINRIHLIKSSIIRSFTAKSSHLMKEGNPKT